MDLFALTPGERDYFRDAAVKAAYRLGIFAALPCEDVAARLGLPGARLRSLMDVLAFEGILDREPWRARSVPPEPRLADEGLGRLAEVIRSDRPLPEPRGEILERFHRHLCEVGAAAAAELAELLAPRLGPKPSIVDLGSGAGTYASALVRRIPGARAVLVDRPEVLALAPPHEGIEKRPGDLFDARLDTCDAALLANVLHLFGPADCARLVARAAAAAGLVAIHDLDRQEEPTALYFALDMALYTEAGDVHPAGRIEGWLRAAGCVRIERAALRAAPASVVLFALTRAPPVL